MDCHQQQETIQVSRGERKKNEEGEVREKQQRKKKWKWERKKKAIRFGYTAISQLAHMLMVVGGDT